MKSDGPKNGRESDSVRGERPEQLDQSATSWLILQVLRLLNNPGADTERQIPHAVGALSERRDSIATVIDLYNAAGQADSTLRWNLLYLLGEIGDESSAEFLAESATLELPQRAEDSCESDWDMEVLVRTMAVQALAQVISRNPKAGDRLTRVIEQRPQQAILIEAVKAARDQGYKEKLRGLLQDQDQWMLDIAQASIEELSAGPDPTQRKERRTEPPSLQQVPTIQPDRSRE